jgi:hypothetical protein
MERVGQTLLDISFVGAATSTPVTTVTRVFSAVDANEARNFEADELYIYLRTEFVFRKICPMRQGPSSACGNMASTLERLRMGSPLPSQPRRRSWSLQVWHGLALRGLASACSSSGFELP